VFRNVGHEI